MPSLIGEIGVAPMKSASQHATKWEEPSAAEYRERAQDARSRALRTEYDQVRQSLLRIAETLDRIALTHERLDRKLQPRGAKEPAGGNLRTTQSDDAAFGTDRTTCRAGCPHVDQDR